MKNDFNIVFGKITEKLLLEESGLIVKFDGSIEEDCMLVLCKDWKTKDNDILENYRALIYKELRTFGYKYGFKFKIKRHGWSEFKESEFEDCFDCFIIIFIIEFKEIIEKNNKYRLIRKM